MNRLSSIKSRLVLLAFVLMALLAVVGGWCLRSMGGMNDSMDTVYKDRVVPLKQLKQVSDAYAVNIVDTTHKVRAKQLEAAAGLKLVDEAQQLVRLQWAAYTSTRIEGEEARLLALALPLRAQAEAATLKLRGLLQTGDAEALEQFATRELYPAIDPFTNAVSALVDEQLKVAEQEYAASQARYQQAIWVVLGVFVLALAAGVVLAWRIIASIMQPLRQALHVAAQISNRDLSATVEISSQDEMGQLLQAMQRMQGQLSQTVEQIRESAEAVSVASGEISLGSNDLSMRTEQQAAALEQTAASMDQMAAAVTTNAETTHKANEMAHLASRTAELSGAAVHRVVSTMDQINGSSKKISDIIGVIDGIAFQTNILALNAAVEAARAGEQGRGFAVVAGEVRILAQRSAQAAREIKGLIGDSVSKVESGSEVAAEAGRTMEALVGQVRQVTTLLGEISTATREQSAGISQVNTAVTQLDHNTQQNAALVEESAAASESLKAQARQLADIVSSFRLSSSDQRLQGLKP
ncbi:methyl-accepting chemotaxis protein [Roseateles sp.]|uniref:methyl-accepting chemotaxis protein n=1 Tax=Roseateles sp. TaxID=1971397 RepID=UPI003D0F3BD0